MGLNEAQKKERSEYLEEYLTITECSQRKPYVFISYASDNWKTVFQSAVVPMQKASGLRVYADKAFDKVNDKWIVPMLRNVRGSDMMVAFVSQSYIESYACFLELLTAVNSRKPIVFVTLEEQLHLGNTTDLPEVERGVKKEILNQGANIATNTNNTSSDVMRAMKSAYTSISTLLEQDALSKYDISDAFINFFRDASINQKAINDASAVMDTIKNLSEHVFDKLPLSMPVQETDVPVPNDMQPSQPEPKSAQVQPKPAAQQSEPAPETAWQQPWTTENSSQQQTWPAQEASQQQTWPAQEASQQPTQETSRQQTWPIQESASANQQPGFAPTSVQQPLAPSPAQQPAPLPAASDQQPAPAAPYQQTLQPPVSPAGTRPSKKLLIACGAGILALIAAFLLISGPLKNLHDDDDPDSARWVVNVAYITNNGAGATGTYTGQWSNSRPNGEGTIVWKTGGRYEGEWKNGRYNGQGTYYIADIVYEGEWENDLLTYGTAKYQDGSTYTGEWKNGYWHGEGTYTYADGTVMSGTWDKGEFVD